MSIANVFENTFDDIYERVEAAGFTGSQLEHQFENEAIVCIEGNGVSKTMDDVFGEDLAGELATVVLQSVAEFDDYDGSVDFRVQMGGETIISFTVDLETGVDVAEDPDVDIDAIIRFLGQ